MAPPAEIRHRQVIPRSYFDSVTLMRLSQAMAAVAGVKRAAVMMGTPANLVLMRQEGLWEDESAGPTDLCVSVVASDSAALVTAQDILQRFLQGREAPAPAAAESPAGISHVHSWPEAARYSQEPRVAVIAVPGAFAATEAMQALDNGFHVFLFSDNVALEDEVTLKQVAAARGRLVMGPDCGTALWHGTPLGFVNRVRAGPVGIVAASGTGAQEVACLLHAAGLGVSHILGTGGRDLWEAVGGLAMQTAIAWLAEDAATERLVIISKPPHPSVAARILNRLGAAGKPAAACFLGAQDWPDSPVPVYATIGQLVTWATGEPEEEPPTLPPLSPGRYVRALMVGGTLAHQAAWALETTVNPADPVPWTGVGHRVVDFGDDRFTVGRPHPMIDGSQRLAALAQTLADPDTGLVLLDLVGGDGADPDPAAKVADIVAKAARPVPVVATVIASDQDPQDLARQRRCLQAAGIMVTRTSTAAALAARRAAGLGPPR